MSLQQDTQSRGQQWLEELLQLSGFPAPVSAEQHTDDLFNALEHREEYPDDSGADPAQAIAVNFWLTIDKTNLTAQQMQILLEPDGAVLDAIQYLANTILNISQPEDSQAAYTIELDGYRTRRQADLLAMVEEAATQVRQAGQEFEIKSLSAAERRQVHTFIKSYPDLATYSRGREPDRRLVVRLAQE